MYSDDKNNRWNDKTNSISCSPFAKTAYSNNQQSCLVTKSQYHDEDSVQIPNHPFNFQMTFHSKDRIGAFKTRLQEMKRTNQIFSESTDIAHFNMKIKEFNDSDTCFNSGFNNITRNSACINPLEGHNIQK